MDANDEPQEGQSSLQNDYRRLKAKVASLERENEALKNSIYELSIRYGAAFSRSKRDQFYVPTSTSTTNPTSTKTQASTLNNETPPSSTSASIVNQNSEKNANNNINTNDIESKESDTSRSSQSGITPTDITTPVSFNALQQQQQQQETMITSPQKPTRQTTSQSVQTTGATTTQENPTIASLLPPLSPTYSNSVNEQKKNRSASTTWDTLAGVNETEAAKELTRQREKEREKGREGHVNSRRKFAKSLSLEGHRGAVYALQFCQNLLISAGMDGIRIWGQTAITSPSRTNDESVSSYNKSQINSINSSNNNSNNNYSDLELWFGKEINSNESELGEIAHLRRHNGPVADVSISSRNSNLLLSGGYDSKVYISDIETSSDWSWSMNVNGLIQSVTWAQEKDLFMFGTSRKAFCLGDIRTPSGTVSTVMNDAMVNSTRSFQSCPYAYIGDSNGNIKTIDLRALQFVSQDSQSSLQPHQQPSPQQQQQQQSHGRTSAISNLALSQNESGQESRWMASTSFDNVVRVYDRADPINKPPSLSASFQTRNRNWPIRCSWFTGSDYLSNNPDKDESSLYPSVKSSLLLASGSADSHVLLYDLSSLSLTSRSSNTTHPIAPTQTLEAHKAEVFAVSFAEPKPCNALLASAGADETIRLWTTTDDRWE